MAAPLPCQPLLFELLDPVCGDLMQEQRAKGPIEDVNDLTIACDAALVLLGVVVKVGGRERPERDVRLLADAVPALEHARSFLRLEFFASCLFAVSVVARYRRRFTRKS